MISSVQLPKAYSEVYSFINALGDSYIAKIPTSIYNTIKENRDINYNPKFDANQKITKDMISQEGLSLIAALNLQYWCEDENEKINLKQTYVNNTKQEDEKYSYDNLFKHKKNETIEVTDEQESIPKETSLVEYKESLFVKIINKIKNIFHFGKKI